MTPLLRTLEDWTTHQDYAWFLAALAWAGVMWGAWPRGRPAAWARDGWLVGLGFVNLCSAVIELALLARDVPGQYVAWDWAMATAQGAGFVCLAWPDGRRRNWRASVGRAAWLAAVLVGLLVVRRQWPVPGGFGLALAQALAAWHLRRRFRAAGCDSLRDAGARRWADAGLQAAVLWPVLATHGPLAHALNVGRINRDFSPFAVPAALCLTVAGAAWCVAAWRERRRPGEGEAAPPALPWAGLRRSLALLAIWLVAGFFLIVWSGRLARRDYEEGLVARARTAALVADPELLHRTLGPALKAGRVESRAYPSGVRVDVIELPLTGEEAYGPLREYLARVHRASPELKFVSVSVVRQGRVVVAATSGDRQPKNRFRLVERPATEADLRRLEARESFFTGPQRGAWGSLVTARSPLIDPVTSRALGWLVLEQSGTRWLATFAQARLQTMGLVGLGVGLWALGLAYTMRRTAVDAAEQRAESAAAAGRMKSEVLATVSHELRTPIQSVLGYGELLAGERLPPEPQRWVEALRTHGQVMLRLVNDLIDFGAMQGGAFKLQPRTVELRRLVEDCVAAVRPLAQTKGLALRWEFSEPLPDRVCCDPVRLRQVLVNLLANAVKFTDHGEVRLQVRTAAAAAPAPVEFIVSDTGPGIPAERRGELFTPFSRLGRTTETEGAGLGLAVVASLCRLMGGVARLDESVSPGACFVVTLPLEAAADGAAPGDLTGADGARPWSGIDLLVADDNALVRELLVAFLEKQGARVVAVGDGRAAVAACEHHAFHAILLDWMMPGQDGLATARALRARSGEPGRVFIIGLSAHAGSDRLAHAHAAGMTTFLAKPVDLASLAHVIAQAPGVPPLAQPAAPTDAALLAALHARFSSDLPGLLAEIAAAAAAGEPDRTVARAHYLKNSADIVGAHTLAAACADLCAAPPGEIRRLAAAVERAARAPFGPPGAGPV